MESSDHIAVQNTSVKPGNSVQPLTEGCHLWIYRHYEMPCWSSQHYAQLLLHSKTNVLHGGNVLRVLRGEMPELAGAEEKAEPKRGWELIYKLGATLNGNGPAKLYLGPLALPSLDTPSLNPPCYNSYGHSSNAIYHYTNSYSPQNTSWLLV